LLTVTILGATGSIGQSTIDLLLQHPDKFRIGGLVAGRDVAAIARLAGNLQPDFVALADESAGPALREALARTGIRNGAGEGAVLEAVARDADIVWRR
jgi:1-deoxy-D-xylulose-5-phosphate reductoisomerase